MKKILLCCLTLAFCSTLMQAKTPPKPANFSGNWVLDTSQTKKLPSGLEGYSMVVSQDEQQLKVQTSLQGDLRPRDDSNGQYPDGGQGTGRSGGYPGRRGGGMGLPGRIGVGWPGGGMGGPMGGGMPGGRMPGGGGGRPRGQGRSQTGAAAFMLYPRAAVYKLDGTASTAQLGGPSRADATLRADWAKGGKLLKLSLLGNGGSGDVRVKDQWKFSKDGPYLMVDRNVHSSRGSGSVHLVFRRQAVDSTNAANESSKE